MVTPAIMTASIDVSKAHKLDSTIQRNIFRILELMALKITKQGLGVIKNDPINLYNLENNPSQLDFQFNSLGDDKNLPLDQD
ncbi:hypothetical protein WAI05_21680, partial [Acinetobacter baumannii]